MKMSLQVRCLSFVLHLVPAGILEQQGSSLVCGNSLRKKVGWFSLAVLLDFVHHSLWLFCCLFSVFLTLVFLANSVLIGQLAHHTMVLFACHLNTSVHEVQIPDVMFISGSNEVSWALSTQVPLTHLLIVNLFW